MKKIGIECLIIIDAERFIQGGPVRPILRQKGVTCQFHFFSVAVAAPIAVAISIGVLPITSFVISVIFTVICSVSGVLAVLTVPVAVPIVAVVIFVSFTVASIAFPISIAGGLVAC